MGRRRSPYHLFKRQGGKRKIYFCRFIESSTGTVRSTRSTGESNKILAVKWAEREIASESEEDRRLTVSELAADFWFVTSEYARSTSVTGHGGGHNDAHLVIETDEKRLNNGDTQQLIDAIRCVEFDVHLRGSMQERCTKSARVTGILQSDVRCSPNLLDDHD